MNIELISAYAKANLKNQITQTYFGWLWWIVEPALTMAIFYFVFAVLLNRGGPGFVYLLQIGVVVWGWFGDTVTHARTSILNERGIISIINVDKVVFPFVTILENLYKQIFIFSILLIFLLVTNGFKQAWVYIPLVLIEQLLVLSAVSVFVAGLVPFFPDLKFVIGIALRAAMFCSGIFYTVSMLPEKIRGYFLLNPMANIIEQFREILIYNKAPNWNHVLIISVLSIIFLYVAIQFVRKNNKLYARLVNQ